jgi:hypothetical protein
MLQRKPAAAVKHQLEGACCLMGEHTFEAIRCSISLLAMVGTQCTARQGAFHFCPERIDSSAEQVGFELSVLEEKHGHAE